jgi:hypothetical protein
VVIKLIEAAIAREEGLSPCGRLFAFFHMQTVIPVLRKPADSLFCVALSFIPHTTELLPAASVLDSSELEKEGKGEEGGLNELATNHKLPSQSKIDGRCIVAYRIVWNQTTRS